MNRPCRLWFDVEDLIDFAERHARPTGIQRVCFEIYRAALVDPAMRERVGFVRHATDERGFVEADWDLLAARFQHVTDRPPEPGPDAATQPTPPSPPRLETVLPDDPVPGPQDAVPARRPSMRLLRRVARMLPQRWARPGLQFAVMQAQAGLALGDTLRLAAGHGARAVVRGSRQGARHGMARLLSREAPAGPFVAATSTKTARRLDQIAERGDVLVVLGSPWFEQEYAELAGYARGRLGMRLAVLVHDVIPVRRPEWVDRGTVRVYRNWYRTVLPLADLVLSNSRATAQDVEQWCAHDNIRLRGPVRPLPIGTGFGFNASDKAGTRSPLPLPPPLQRRLGARPFVLFVSTIEARKNHLLLFRVWRRLLSEMAPDQVPELVFAGRVGWLVNDLMDQITNSRHLDGRLHVIQGLDDASLRSLYDHCLFTVFPSFYEGWGLPVSESLALGAPCVSSNSTSLPEAGGELTRYFDPFDLNDATRVIRDTIADGAGLAAWRARVLREFKPVGWDRTAAALLEAVDATP